MPVSTEFRSAGRFMLALCLWLAGGHPVLAEPLAPFRDGLFSYGTVLETADGGDYRVVDYQELRDINGRDDIPERRVRRKYVALGIKRQQVNETLDLGGTSLDVTRVGPRDKAEFSVIFVHGRGGDRRLGSNDHTFGGNFNRLKNLSVENGGVYYVPSVRSFDAAGIQAVAALIAHASQRSAGNPVILACASMGSFICWGAARERATARLLKGLIVMGGASDPAFVGSPAERARVPLYLTHGTRDSVYDAKDQVALYRRLKSKGGLARIVLFETGSHGTPVRMTDWRDAINWVLTH